MRAFTDKYFLPKYSGSCGQNIGLIDTLIFFCRAGCITGSATDILHSEIGVEYKSIKLK